MRKIGYILLLILLSSCAVNKDLPDWIDGFQHDPAYFSALIKVKTSQPGYKERAREMAANEIAMQISTIVESSIQLTQSEVMGISGTEYLSQIRSSSSAELKNISPLHSVESGGTYYVLYRLNKAEFYANRRRQRDMALDRAALLINQYDELSANPSIALPHLLNALDTISPYLDMELQISGVDLANAIYTRLHRLPSMLGYKWSRESISAKAKSEKSLLVGGTVYLESSAVPVSDLPLVISSETINASGTVFSDSGGNFEYLIKRIDSMEPIQYLNISLDKEHYRVTLSNPNAARIWDNIVFPVNRLRLDVLPPTIFLDYTYVSGFQGGYREAIASALANLNIGLANKLSEADYLLKIRIEPIKGEYLSNMNYYTAKANIRMNLIETIGNSSVNYLDYPELKSGGKTREIAERNVEREAAELIGNTLLYRLLYQHIIQ
jgi:hypothetical protein